MGGPRFSVVIPTRERAGTLKHSLATCINQDFDDYEIIVGDNCSSPATRQVVEQCGSARARYVRAPHPLAMSANWELALSQARGEYLLFLGDDDGLMPYALREIDALLVRLRCPVLHWKWAYYTWPTFPQAEDANYLVLPLSREIHQANARARLLEVARFESNYSVLPMLYANAVIHRDLIAVARGRSGRVFHNRIPDVYSGIVFGYLGGDFPSVSVPMTVSGVSGQSNGFAVLNGSVRDAIAHEFTDLNAAQGYSPHPRVPDLRLLDAQVADSFQFARDLFFPGDDGLALDRRLVADRCIRGLWTTDPGERIKAMSLVRDALADDTELLSWFDASGLADAPPGPRPRSRCLPSGTDGDHLFMRADQFGVQDVAGAVDLCARLLGHARAAIRYDLPSRAAVSSDYEAELGRSQIALESLHESGKRLERRLLDVQRSWLTIPYRVHRKVRRLLRSDRQAG